MNVVNEQAQVLQGLQKEWDIILPEIISEAAILMRLEQRVAEILQHGPDEFFQLMYRLDISESKLSNAMYTSASPAADIARLIYDRQLQKIRTTRAFSQSHRLAEDDEDLRW
jgi:hypothetical protein